MDRQAERRQDRYERKYNADGTKKSKEDRKAMRQQQRADRAASNIKRQQDLQNQIRERKSLRDVQRSQGSFGGEKYQVGNVRENQSGIDNRVTKSLFTPTQISKAVKTQSEQPTTFQEVANTLGTVFGKKRRRQHSR